MKIGFELEYWGVSPYNKLLSFFQNKGFVVKSEYLMGEDGYELVSPVYTHFLFFSYNKHKWINVFDYIKKIRSRVSNEIDGWTGMHVHIERRITNQSVEQIDNIISDNIEFFENLGSRPRNRFCSYQKTLPEYIGHKEKINDLKYRALNVTGNQGRTIEFRFFKSTTNINCFFKNMQTAISLVKFVSLESGEICNLQNWINYVLRNKKKYAELCAYLEKNGYKIINPKTNKVNPIRKIYINEYPNQKVKHFLYKKIKNKHLYSRYNENSYWNDIDSIHIRNLHAMVFQMNGRKNKPLNTIKFLRDTIKYCAKKKATQVCFINLEEVEQKKNNDSEFGYCFNALDF